ncbi:MAG: hypothetical protein BWK79_16430 [Beggiatoa sp. IS2]|nr:MAG: hypothetical protein BWK79_16430 [Beggiatoa sp. IS2]
MGLLTVNPDEYLQEVSQGLAVAEIDQLITARNAARTQKNWAEADRIRDVLQAQGVVLEDSATGTSWRRG